jgi:hypothetical protein
MSSFIPNLKELSDIVKSHAGSDLTEKSEPILSAVLGRFDSILGSLGAGKGVDNTIEAAVREKSTDWGLLLKDTADFLQTHKNLVQDGQSQALRIDEDIRVLIDVVHTKVAKGGIDDKGYLVSFRITSNRENGSKKVVLMEE